MTTELPKLEEGKSIRLTIEGPLVKKYNWLEIGNTGLGVQHVGGDLAEWLRTHPTYVTIEILPDPLPKLLGAVVKDARGRILVRAELDVDGAPTPWRLGGTGEDWGQWLSDAEIDRPFTIIHPGVEVPA